jgi:hypothetical protein
MFSGRVLSIRTRRANETRGRPEPDRAPSAPSSSTTAAHAHETMRSTGLGGQDQRERDVDIGLLSGGRLAAVSVVHVAAGRLAAGGGRATVAGFCYVVICDE